MLAGTAGLDEISARAMLRSGQAEAEGGFRPKAEKHRPDRSRCMSRSAVYSRAFAPLSSERRRGPDSGSRGSSGGSGAGPMGRLDDVGRAEERSPQRRIGPHNRGGGTDNAIAGCIVLVGTLTESAVRAILGQVAACDRGGRKVHTPRYCAGFRSADAGARRSAQERQRQERRKEAQECASEHDVAGRFAVDSLEGFYRRTLGGDAIALQGRIRSHCCAHWPPKGLARRARRP